MKQNIKMGGAVGAGCCVTFISQSLLSVSIAGFAVSVQFYYGGDNVLFVLFVLHDPFPNKV